MKWLRCSLLGLGLALQACAVPPAASVVTGGADGSDEAIRDRTTNLFNVAVLYKPDSRFEAEPTFQLAPLIVQEWVGETHGGEKGETGPELARGEAGDETNAVVYAHADVVPFRGTNLLRSAYVWVYATARGGGVKQLQGVRVTADTRGRPVLWELLNAGSNKRVLFASATVEQEAAEEFGAAPPGRRYALEKSEEQEPGTVVARVLEDGPVAMGPIVYVTREPSVANAVLCRCMPSQAKGLVETRTYVIRDFAKHAEWLDQLRGGQETAFWPLQDAGEATALERVRWPAAF